MACILVPKVKPGSGSFFLNQQDLIQRTQSEVCIKQNPCLILDLVLGKPIKGDKKIKKENITIFTFLVRLDNKLTSMRNRVFQKSLSRDSHFLSSLCHFLIQGEHHFHFISNKTSTRKQFFFIDASCLGKRVFVLFCFLFFSIYGPTVCCFPGAGWYSLSSEPLHIQITVQSLSRYVNLWQVP